MVVRAVLPFCCLQCRLPGSDGTWMVVEGGMRVVTQQSATERPRTCTSATLNPRRSSFACLLLLCFLQCRLPGSDGTWMVVEGGMGVVTQQLATKAMAAGARIHTAAPVKRVEVQGGQATGVELGDGTRVDARVVMVNADPFRLRTLAGAEQFTLQFNSWLDSLKKDGTTMKVSGGQCCNHYTVVLCTCSNSG